MRQETLLVIAKDKHAYEKWVNKFGTRLKNIQFVYVSGPEVLLGWDFDTTYWTTLKGSERRTGALKAVREESYKHVPQDKFEDKVKKLSGPKGPQR